MSEASSAVLQHSDVRANILCGVKGWLKFFVAVKMYVAPPVFVLQQIAAWAGFVALVEDYPMVIPVGLLETGVLGLLTVKWIQVAMHLRDIEPGAVQEAKKWLKITLAVMILSIPVAFLMGLDPEVIAVSATKTLVSALIGFTVWYSYFCVSKRVKATYPDWDKSIAPQSAVLES